MSSVDTERSAPSIFTFKAESAAVRSRLRTQSSNGERELSVHNHHNPTPKENQDPFKSVNGWDLSPYVGVVK
jgi:hypothetical protein